METGKLIQWLERSRKALVTIAATIAALLAILNRGQNPPADTSPAPITPPTGKAPPQVPAPEPLQAIGRIQFGNAGCTATVIGPRRADGKWNVLTAAHCLAGQPELGRMELRNGKVITVKRMVVDDRSDCAWLITADTHENLPYALLADSLPSAGQKVWHAGFGVDVPGNTEYGTVVNSENADGQTEFRLSVSSGDSGGGIALDGSGKVLSAVCCTTNRGGTGRVWGCSVESIRKTLQRLPVSSELWTPIQVPLRMESTNGEATNATTPGQIKAGGNR